MEKTASKLMLAFLLISMLTLTVDTSPIKAYPGTIYVDDRNTAGPWDGTLGHPYENITSGLAHASNGDTIFVNNGTYFENLIVNKTITLIGQSKDGTIIDGKKEDSVIQIGADNVTIANFTLQNGGTVYYQAGIYLEHGMNCKITQTIIRNNYNGAFIQNSTNSLFADNDLSGNLEGIYLINSSNSIFVNNKISGSSYAIVLNNAQNNTIFHNNFINNTNSVSSVFSANLWDNGLEGNYWSGYNGRDENQDAIIDAPYVIDANNQDKHPLAGLFSDFTVIYENETYHVSTISNSTVFQPQLNETIKMLNFSFAGINDTVSFYRVMLPNLLVNPPHVVIVDHEQVNATSLPVSNATHTFLYFTYYYNSTHTLEVNIISKPFYELSKAYTNLVSTYNQLLTDCDMLNETLRIVLTGYLRLSSDYDALNKTYWQTVADYAKLQSSYSSLNQTYEQTYAILQSSYSSLNQTYEQTWANYTQLQINYTSIQATFDELKGEYDSLTSAYDRIQSEYANTQRAVWYVTIAAAALIALTSSLAITYHRRFKEQKTLVEKQKMELEQFSLLNVARTQFEADVKRRKERIDEFKHKYGIVVRPRDTLEEVMGSLEQKRKRED